MVRTFAVLFLLGAAGPACSIIEDDTDCVGGKCDGTGGGECPDKRYGDAVCDLSLDCATPDIDCFRTFQSDDEAATWYAEFEARLAQESGEAPRAVVPTTDPRFAKIRQLLDRGWKAFSENRPVGLLAGLRPALVFVEDPSVNAFVVPDLDLKHARFAVMVHTGLLGMEATDDAMLGLMMHELQHAVGLHVIGEVKERFKTYYTAPDGKEPIGRNQRDDERVRAAASAWIAAGREIGSLSNAELGGLPLSGDLFRIMRTVLQSGLQTNPAACQAVRDQVNQISIDLGGVTDPISGGVAAPASITPRIATALAAMRDQCMAGFTLSFVDVVASIAGATPEQIEGSLTPEDKALVTGKHVVDAISLLGENRRAKMRSIEAAFATEVGRPWSALRYFTTEEDADDISVPVLRGARLDPTGLASFLGGVLDPATLAACRGVVDKGGVPHYGVDLVDDHHGTCWRMYHIGAYAKETDRVRPLVERPAVAPAPRLLPPRLSDVVMH